MALESIADTYRDNFDKLYRWFIGIEETDPKNYFGGDNAQETSGDGGASIRLSNTMSVSFVSGDTELNIVDGAVQSSKMSPRRITMKQVARLLIAI